MIYLDNAATSGQKPQEVYDAVTRAMKECSGNPGRSGHRISLAAGSAVEEARLNLSRLFGCSSAERLVFCSNATDALNLAIKGTVTAGSHVITTSMEHNSVSRPLETLRTQKGVSITKVTTDINTGADINEIENAINADTSLVVINHVSNVTGTVSDIAAIGRICREHNVPFLVDASQSAGAFDIDVESMCIDMLAFPGHKSLMGPQGTGGLYIGHDITLHPLKEGGTGSRSELLTMPEMLPDRYESGTLNVPGIAGLGAGAAFINEIGIEAAAAKEKALVDQLIDGLYAIPAVNVLAPAEGHPRGAAVSITIDDTEPQDIGLLLDQAFDIAVRSGLHCAPDAHQTLGTISTGGTIRISPGYFNTEEDIARCIDAVSQLAEG